MTYDKSGLDGLLNERMLVVQEEKGSDIKLYKQNQQSTRFIDN